MVFEKKISNTSEKGNKSIAYMYKHVPRIKRKKRITYKKMGRGGGVRLDCSILYSQYQENNFTRVNKEDTWVVLQWRIAISFQILRHLIEIRGRFVKK